jgi:Tfp pilus assembly protein PilZ
MGIMHVQNHRGQNQYIVIELVDLIDKYAKTRRFAWIEPANNERIKGAKVGWKMKN